MTREQKHLRLRDRDAIISNEGIIFRVYGYSHPPEGYICDVEYASSKIYSSNDPRAFRAYGSEAFYKFYFDEGLKFVLRRFPKYTIYYRPLRRKLVGVRSDLVAEVRKPDKKLQDVFLEEAKDALIFSLKKVLNLIISISNLSVKNFGVFGSILHDFYHPSFSDIDLVIYGRENLRILRDILGEMYSRSNSALKNEFADKGTVAGKRWRFKNYSLGEYLWHQRRKRIYAIYESKYVNRRIKVEFEPVREWSEIFNDYGEVNRIVNEGWIKATARVLDDCENSFMPSIYSIEIIDVLDGPRIDNLKRIVSFVEEFRMQAWRDEIIYVEGNLERVETKNDVFQQITLTYMPARYYEQVLKVMKPSE